MTNRIEEIRRSLSNIDASAPKFGTQHFDLATTPSKKSPTDGGAQSKGVFPGLSPRTQSALDGIASAYDANIQSVALASALPASFGTNTLEIAAHIFRHHKQVIASVPAFP